MARLIPTYSAMLLMTVVSGCSALIDVDDYDYGNETGGVSVTGGTTETGGRMATGGMDETGGSMTVGLRANLETLQAQFTTGCIPSDGGDVPGEEYVITIVPGAQHKLRRDLINYTSGCEAPLWVEVLEGPVELVPLQGAALETGLKVTVERYALKFVHETAAQGARENALFGIDNWQMNTWHSLLGVETLVDEGGESFAVNAEDELFLRVEIVGAADGKAEDVQFSYPVFDALPVSTDFVTQRTDGKQGVDVRFPINN